MYPPTAYFDSTKGPSVAPDSDTTLPPALSFPPMSTMLSLNFSFQALNAAYISCICAGEGCCGFCCVVSGILRWINRYFGILVLLWLFRRPEGQHTNDARRHANWTALRNFFCAARTCVRNHGPLRTRP